MAYSDDLLQHAILLADLNLSQIPKQVDLRRAVSAAYYSVFHLLSGEAASNWKNVNQRNRFARLFEHGRMKTCSAKAASRPVPDEAGDAAIATDLKLVASSFVKLQEARHTADYDHAMVWSRTEVYEMILLAQEAAAAWSKIRETDLAQDYLIELLGSRQ